MCGSFHPRPVPVPKQAPEPHPFCHSSFPVERAMPELFPAVEDSNQIATFIESTFPRAFPDEVERFVAFTLASVAISKAVEAGKTDDPVWCAITWETIDKQLSFWWRAWHFKRKVRCLLWIVSFGFRGAPMRASHRMPLACFQWILPGRDQAVLHVKAALGRLASRKLIRPCLHRSAGRILNVYEPLPALVKALNVAAT